MLHNKTNTKIYKHVYDRNNHYYGTILNTSSSITVCQ